MTRGRWLLATVGAALAADEAAASSSIATQLGQLTFLHVGRVGGASDNISHFTQCNGFSEDGALWTQWGPRSYAYNVSADGALSAPAIGIRSAVPLGGLGTGSFELRADGTFADWTVENQGTALAADATRNSKIPLKDEVLLGVFVQSQAPGAPQPFAASLRIAPPQQIPRIGSLTYSGAFPFAKLVFEDDAWPLKAASSSDAPEPPAVYAYSPFKLYSSDGSAGILTCAVQPHYIRS